MSSGTPISSYSLSQQVSHKTPCSSRKNSIKDIQSRNELIIHDKEILKSLSNLIQQTRAFRVSLTRYSPKYYKLSPIVYNMNLIIQICRSTNIVIPTTIIKDIVSLTLEMIPTLYSYIMGEKVLELLYDVKSIVSKREENRQELTEPNILVSIEISKAVLYESRWKIGNDKYKYIKKSLDECSFCLSKIYKNSDMLKYLDKVENVLLNVESLFFHYIGKEYLIHKLEKSLNERIYNQFEETYNTFKTLTQYLNKRKFFDLSKNLYDIKFIGQLMTSQMFEKFAVKMIKEVSKINELELMHINIGSEEGTSNSNDYDKPTCKIYREELVKLRMQNRPKKIIYREVKDEIQNNEDIIIFSDIDLQTNIPPYTMSIFQNNLSKGLKSLFKSIIEFILEMIGPYPYSFCVLGLGSHSRSEIFPYSDFEFALLLENDDDDNNFPTSYFGRFLECFDFLIHSIGEPTGFRLDAQGTPKEYRFRGTPDTMISKIFGRIDLHSIPLAFSMIHPTCIYASDEKGEELYQSYITKVKTMNLNSQWKNENQTPFHQGFATYCLNDHMKMMEKKWKSPFGDMNHLLNPDLHKIKNHNEIHLKDQYIMPLTCVICDIALYYCYPFEQKRMTTIDLIKSLSSDTFNIFDSSFSRSLTYALNALSNLRFRIELETKEQIDTSVKIILKDIQPNNEYYDIDLDHSDDSFYNMDYDESFWIHYCEWVVKRPLHFMLPLIYEMMKSNSLKLYVNKNFSIETPFDPAIQMMNIEIYKYYHHQQNYANFIPREQIKSLAWTLAIRGSTITEHFSFYRRFPYSWREFYRGCIYELSSICSKLNEVLFYIDTYPHYNGDRLQSVKDTENWKKKIENDMLLNNILNEFEILKNNEDRCSLRMDKLESFMVQTINIDDETKHNIDNMILFNEYISYTLSERLFYRSACKKTFKSGISPQKIVFYITEKINSVNLKEVLTSEKLMSKILPKIDPKSFTQAFLLSAILMHTDGHPENYIVEKFDRFNENINNCVETYYKIIPLHQRNSFTDFAIVSYEDVYLNNNILFSMDNMLNPIDPSFINEFLEMDPFGVILTWINDLIMFKEQEQYFHINISKKVVRWIYEVLSIISSTFRESISKENKITHLDILKLIHPLHGHCCERLLSKKMNPLERYCTLSESISTTNVYLILEHSYHLSNQRIMLKNTISNEDPDELLAYLKNMKFVNDEELEIKALIKSASTSAISSKLENINRFQRHLIINNIDFIDLSSSVSDAIFHLYEIDKKINDIVLKNCMILDNSKLESILKNSNHITKLQLSGCKKLSHRNLSQNDVLKIISEYCPNLEIIDLSDTQLKHFALYNHKLTQNTSDITFQKLEWLALNNCPNIEKIKLTSPNLKHLDARNCPLLTVIDVKTNRLATANFQGCWKISCRDILQKSLAVSKTISQLTKGTNKKKNEYVQDFEKIISNEVRDEFVISGQPLTVVIIECYMIAFLFNESIRKIIFASGSVTEDNIYSLSKVILSSKGTNIKEITFVNCKVNPKIMDQIKHEFQVDGRFEVTIL